MVFMSSLFKKILNTDWHWILSEKSKICSKCLHLNNLHYANILHYQAVLKTTVFSVQKKKMCMPSSSGQKSLPNSMSASIQANCHCCSSYGLIVCWTNLMLNKSSVWTQMMYLYTIYLLRQHWRHFIMSGDRPGYIGMLLS